MHVDQRVLQQRHIPQSNFTIFADWMCQFADWNRPRGVSHPPTHPLGAGPVLLWFVPTGASSEFFQKLWGYPKSQSFSQKLRSSHKNVRFQLYIANPGCTWNALVFQLQYFIVSEQWSTLHQHIKCRRTHLISSIYICHRSFSNFSYSLVDTPYENVVRVGTIFIYNFSIATSKIY